jgi:anti-anti-sigma factor
MKLIKEIRDNAAVLTLKGEFDSFVCQPFMEEIKGLIKNKVVYLILDMRLVLFINSTAIGTLVKIHKEAKAQGGKLVLCRPSNFVHGVLDSLGLLGLFAMADDPEKALQEVGASGEGMDMGGENSVILHVPGSKDTCIAKLAVLEEEGMTLNVTETPKDFKEGVKCDVKFRLPLFRKGHYFEGSVVINSVTAKEVGVQVKCAFDSMKDEDRKSIAQFVEEMKFLRAEAKKD